MSTAELQVREKWCVYADGDYLLTTYSRERAHGFADTLGPDWKSIWVEHVVTTQERIR